MKNNNNILSMFSTGYRSTLSSLNQLPNANPSLSSSSFPNAIMSLMREIILFWWPRPQNCNWVEERGDNPLNFSLPRSTPINARDKCNVKMFFSDPVTVLLSLGWWSVFSKHLTVIKSLPFFPPSHFTFGFSLFFCGTLLEITVFCTHTVAWAFALVIEGQSNNSTPWHGVKGYSDEEAAQGFSEVKLLLISLQLPLCLLTLPWSWSTPGVCTVTSDLFRSSLVFLVGMTFK